LVNSGITLERATFTLGTLAVGGIAGKLLFGYLAERFGARVAAIINLMGQATFAMALGFAVTSLSLSLLTPAFGLFMGGFGVLITLLVQDTFGLRHFGSIMGLVNVSNIVSFGLGPIIAGLSYDLTGAYTTGFAITAGLFALGALVLLTVRLPGRAHATAS
jgi:MFS family permease